MDEIEIGVLEACQEYVSRQHEMLPQIAAALGIEKFQVFYTWAFRRIPQRGKLADTNWAYFFHGLECDLRNQKDGRFLRVDFGPKGRVGLLDPGGVLRLIMTSVTPWREFPQLRLFFAKSGPPFDEFSGDWQKMSPVWRRLESKGFFEQADPSLIALQAKFTTRGTDGLDHVRFPPDIAPETHIDSLVARRQQLSENAVRLLNTRAQNGIPLVESSITANPEHTK